MVGYTVFSDKSATGPISPKLTERVLETQPTEIETYVTLLTTEMKADLPDLCEYDAQTAINAMTEAIQKMADCKELSAYACQRYAWVTSC